MKRILVVLAVVALTMWGATAQAAPLIDFGTGTAGPGGTIIETPNGVIGDGILLGVMTVLGGTIADGVYSLAPPAILNFSWGAGVPNAITVTGAVADLGIASTELLSGSFTSFHFGELGGVFAVSGSGLNVVSSELLAALGIPLDTRFQFANFNFAMDGVAFSTDLPTTPVPEPGSLLLLGTGLLGLAGVVRRRMK